VPIAYNIIGIGKEIPMYESNEGNKSSRIITPMTNETFPIKLPFTPAMISAIAAVAMISKLRMPGKGIKG